jgi:hypothetical protein
MLKKVIGYDDGYWVSDSGEVYSDKRSQRKRLSEEIIRCGYVRINIQKNSSQIGVLLHRLVADAFLEKPDWATEINHIDGNKRNNCASNLEWSTRSNNLKHAFKNGLLKSMRGSVNKASKLTEESVKKIKNRLRNENNVGLCPLIAKEYGVTKEAIYSIRDGKNWGWL